MDLAQKLKEEIDTISWNGLTTHFAKGNVILIGQELDLLTAAIAVANDDTETIKTWMAEKSFLKPDVAEATIFSKHNTNFQFLIIQPFVLVKEITETH